MQQVRIWQIVSRLSLCLGDVLHFTCNALFMLLSMLLRNRGNVGKRVRSVRCASWGCLSSGVIGLPSGGGRL